MRALDDSLFQRDWLIRVTRKTLDTVLDRQASGGKTEHLDFFPDEWTHPVDDPMRREAAAIALNAITIEAHDDSLSEEAWTVLARLPGNEGAAGTKPTISKERGHNNFPVCWNGRWVIERWNSSR